MDINLTEINDGNNANVERFKGASWFEDMKKTVITVIGCGGIGSMTVFYLSRMDPACIYVWDRDTVDNSNLAGQLFGVDDINLPKVDAIYKLCKGKSFYYSLSSFRKNFESTDNIPYQTNIVISAVDDMDARKTIFDKWLKSPATHLIDGRCSADVYQIFTLSKDNEYNIKKYQEEFLFPQEEADETICSYKQTSFITGMIGSMISNIVASIVNNFKEENPIRIIPFMMEYDSNIMNLKTIM